MTENLAGQVHMCIYTIYTVQCPLKGDIILEVLLDVVHYYLLGWSLTTSTTQHTYGTCSQYML